MKKKTAVVFVCIMLLLLTACGGNSSPKAVVNKFCNAVKHFNIIALSQCVVVDTEDYGEIKDILGDGSEYKALFDVLKKMASKLEYQIDKVETDGKSATVTVEFKHYDLSPAAKTAFERYLVESFSKYFSGGTPDLNDFYNILIEEINIDELEMTEGTGSFVCVKEKGGWKISSMSRSVYNAILGNFLEGFGLSD